MTNLFESLDITDEMKKDLNESFDKAVMAKTMEMLDEHVEKELSVKEEILKEEFDEKISDLEDTLDGYMDSISEEFIAANESQYDNEISEEKVKTLLEMFDAMLKVAGVTMEDIHEAKDERDEELDEASIENQLELAKARLSDKESELHEAKREAQGYLKAGVIAELSEELTIIEKSKFEKLAEMATFSQDSTYIENLEMIKESIVDARSEESTDIKESYKLPSDAYAPKKVDMTQALDFDKYL